MLRSTPRRMVEYEQFLAKVPDGVDLDSPENLRSAFLYSPTYDAANDKRPPTMRSLQASQTSKGSGDSGKFNFSDFDYSPRRSPRLGDQLEQLFESTF